MLILVLALFFLLPLISFWLFPTVTNIDVISFVSEFIMAGTVLTCIVNLKKFKQGERSNQILFVGFSILFTAIYIDALDELFEFPKIITIVIEDIFQIIGLLMIVYGITLWLKKQETQKNALVKLATTDPLTGAYTRRYFTDKVKEILQSEKPRFCILLFDIDHFKKINDQYGHNVGDLALVEFSSLMEKSSRESDLFARWGGEEFILLLPHIALSSATEKAEQLRQKLADTVIQLPEVSFTMTVSIGVVEFNPVTPKLETLIDIADQRLYKAKQQGRNQVVSS